MFPKLFEEIERKGIQGLGEIFRDFRASLFNFGLSPSRNSSPLFSSVAMTTPPTVAFRAFSVWKTENENVFKRRIGFSPKVVQEFRNRFSRELENVGGIRVLLQTLNFIKNYDKNPHDNWDINADYFREEVHGCLQRFKSELPQVHFHSSPFSIPNVLNFLPILSGGIKIF